MAKDFMYSSLYKDLTKVVQLRFDEISKQHKELFDNIFYKQYFNWDTPSIGLNFEEMKGIYNVSVVAATIGDRSKEPVIGTESPAVIAQKVLHHAITKSMTSETYRRILMLQTYNRIIDKSAMDDLINIMWGDVTTVVNAVEARLDVIAMQALSNEGVATIDDASNPEGGVRTTVDFGMPEKNKFTADTAWTAENKDTIDVFETINELVEKASDRVVLTKILADRRLVSYVCQCAEVKKAIWGSDKSSSMVTLPLLNQYMESMGLPTFEVVRREVRILNQGKETWYRPWNPNNLVFIPDGKLGVIKNAYADAELKPEPQVAYSKYNRILVSQWGVGETQDSNGVEFTKAQVYALPVITEIDGIYSMNTQAG
ncbi:MAG: major capsid protein, partial [Prevotellaceae bacterium]|nr:major capsid protein [Prevotellaceae bacterium]